MLLAVLLQIYFKAEFYLQFNCKYATKLHNACRLHSNMPQNCTLSAGFQQACYKNTYYLQGFCKHITKLHFACRNSSKHVTKMRIVCRTFCKQCAKRKDVRRSQRKYHTPSCSTIGTTTCSDEPSPYVKVRKALPVCCASSMVACATTTLFSPLCSFCCCSMNIFVFRMSCER